MPPPPHSARVPSCRARPATEAFSQRICPTEHAAREVSSARGRARSSSISVNAYRAARFRTAPGPLAPDGPDRASAAGHVDRRHLPPAPRPPLTEGGRVLKSPPPPNGGRLSPTPAVDPTSSPDRSAPGRASAARATRSVPVGPSPARRPGGRRGGRDDERGRRRSGSPSRPKRTPSSPLGRRRHHVVAVDPTTRRSSRPRGRSQRTRRSHRRNGSPT